MFITISEDTQLFSDYISSYGYSYHEVMARFAGRFPKEGSSHCDLLSSLSIKCVNDVKSVFGDMPLWNPEDSILQGLKCIFMHKNPHIDEYLSSLFFRACLPASKQNLFVDEVALTSKDNDIAAMQTWPAAAVFGIGNTYSGGAKPLISFDEHVREGEEKAVNSLAMLMKRRIIGNRQAPPPVFRILNEVNHIDAFGGAHQKNLANYIKNLHFLKLQIKNNDGVNTHYIPPRWKQTIVDVCVTSFILGIQEQRFDFQSISVWLPIIKEELKKFTKKTALKADPLFGSAFYRVSQFMTDIFDKELKNDRVKLCIPDKKGSRVPKRFSGEYVDQIMLVPYLSVLIERYFGEDIAFIMLAPLWEARVAREIENTMTRKTLEEYVPGDDELINADSPIGRLTVLHCDGPDDDFGEPEGERTCTWIFDLDASSSISSPNTLNFFISRNNSGNGYTIYRDYSNGYIVLTKSYAISEAEWEAVCEELILSEGITNGLCGKCGCWHVTRNTNGVAGFLLNGNPSHLYVPRSNITAESLRDLIHRVRLNMKGGSCG